MHVHGHDLLLSEEEKGCRKKQSEAHTPQILRNASWLLRQGNALVKSHGDVAAESQHDTARVAAGENAPPI